MTARPDKAQRRRRPRRELHVRLYDDTARHERLIRVLEALDQHLSADGAGYGATQRLVTDALRLYFDEVGAGHCVPFHPALVRALDEADPKAEPYEGKAPVHNPATSALEPDRSSGEGRGVPIDSSTSDQQVADPPDVPRGTSGGSELDDPRPESAAQSCEDATATGPTTDESTDEAELSKTDASSEAVPDAKVAKTAADGDAAARADADHAKPKRRRKPPARF